MRARTAAILYSTGVESRGIESIGSVVNLALLTGNLGKAGAGIFALTEQNNLQGVCDMGMLPDRFPGYDPVTDVRRREFLESLWHCQLSAEPGLSARAILDKPGPVRALWLGRYDPVSTASFCDASAMLQRFDFIVVQHLFMTRTAHYADVILPVVAFGEERVSFTSTERRIQLAEKVIEPPPGPKPAWQQITELARALGANWNYTSAADVMAEIGQAVSFYSGASYDNLSRDYGRQWPCTKDKPLGTRFLFEEGIPGKPFRFRPISPPTPVFEGMREFPFVLIFGHSLYYWNQNILVQHSETLKRELRVLLLDYPNGFVEMNSADAKQLGIRDGASIRVAGPKGSAVTTARVTHEVRNGTVFVPFFVREVEKQILGGSEGLDVISDPRVFVRIEKA